MGNFLGGLRDDQKLNTAQLKEKLRTEDVLLVDVRNDSERQKYGAIEPSINIPYPQLERELNLTPEEFKSKYDVDKPNPENQKAAVVFYCQHGFRGSAAVKLANEKFGLNSQNFVGGYLRWEK